MASWLRAASHGHRRRQVARAGHRARHRNRSPPITSVTFCISIFPIADFSGYAWDFPTLGGWPADGLPRRLPFTRQRRSGGYSRAARAIFVRARSRHRSLSSESASRNAVTNNVRVTRGRAWQWSARQPASMRFREKVSRRRSNTAPSQELTWRVRSRSVTCHSAIGIRVCRRPSRGMTYACANGAAPVLQSSPRIHRDRIVGLPALRAMHGRTAGGLTDLERPVRANP